MNDPRETNWQLQMMLIEEERRQSDRRQRLGWIGTAVSMVIGFLFVAWVISLV
jgi:high-affinity Fe2+/Pb2+ permease